MFCQYLAIFWPSFPRQDFLGREHCGGTIEGSVGGEKIENQ